MYKDIILFLFFFNFSLLGQYNNPDRLINSNHAQKKISLKHKPGHFYTTITTKDGDAKVYDIDLTEEMDIIVEFKDEPLFLKQKQQKFFKANAEAYQTKFTQFNIDVNNIHHNVSRQLGVDLKIPEIKRTYYKVFNGVSLQTTRALLSGIASLNYVKKIHMDNDVKADLRESVPLIKADSVWYQFGNQGDSIVVGIIDCGIDYNHPALGKGYGKGHKVIGGWDFVNNDNDPMDDVGHGTHVAGIIAGNSDSIKGVAPNSLLMAFKVIDANGNGKESNVIAGIERAMDPNNDDNYEDKVDIVNMSLGSIFGEPDDAVSTAVDNAVRLGTVFSISAGNEGGFGFSSIGSPGTSRLAITVGASDKKDIIASFSSKGPNKNIYTIKPDVIAPGVGIYSSLLHETYGKHDGTSMATPFVSGVCALLKKIHPSWGPEEIKSALMITAKNINEEVMVQGAGRIDALAAAKISTLVIPSQLSFGLDDLKQSIWNKNDTLIIKNESKEIQNYDINISGLCSGIIITAIPSNFSLLSGDSLPIKFNLQVDNNLVPNPSDTIGRSSSTFSGYIDITGSKDIIHIPWAFVKSAKVIFIFDKPSVSETVLLLNDKHYYSSILMGKTKTELLIESGKYDLFAFALEHDSTFSSHSKWRLNIKENIILGLCDTVEVKMADAQFTIKCVAKDNNGNDIPEETEKNPRIFGYSFELPFSVHFNFSANFNSGVISTSFSDRIKFNPWGSFATTTNNKAWFLDFGFHAGVSCDTEFTTNYSKFIEQKFRMNIPVQVIQPDAQLASINISALKTGEEIDIGSLLGSFNINNGQCNGTLYIMRLNENEYFRSSLTMVLSSGKNICYFYPPFSLFNDSVGLYYIAKPTRNIFCIPKGQEIIMNNGLIYANNYHKNNQDGSTNILAYIKFYGFLNEERSYDRANTIIYLYDENNNLIKSEILGLFVKPFLVPYGKYRTEIINTNYYIQKQQGKAKLVSKYDLSIDDPNPPMINSLQIRNSNRAPTEKLGKNETATLLLAASDNLYYDIPLYRKVINPVLDDSTSIYVKEYGTKVWNKIPVNKISEDTLIGCYYSADLSKYTNYDSSALDIKLVLYDKAGNSTEYTLEPAIAIGKFEGTLTGINEESPISVIPKEYKLYNNYPNPFNPSTTISYSLPEKAKVKIEIYNILGQKVTTLFESIEEAGNYKLTWNAFNQSSGIYICRLKAEGYKTFEKNQKLILIK
jgi:hypothetical protein